MSLNLRPATLEDASALLDIYSYYVKETAVSFEWTLPTLQDFRERIARFSLKYPYLVLEDSGNPLGFSYAHSFNQREAYAWSAETSIYLRYDSLGQGLGQKLYEVLEQALKKQGIRNLYALVAYTDHPDPYLTKRSFRFHQARGFSQVGHLHSCGFKFNRWYDLVLFEKSLV